MHTVPVVSFLWPENTASSDGGLVTVSGLDFLSSDATATAGLGSQSCSTTSWASGTSVVCSAKAEAGTAIDAVTTVGGVIGTQTGGFTFDGPHLGEAVAFCFFDVVIGA